MPSFVENLTLNNLIWSISLSSPKNEPNVFRLISLNTSDKIVTEVLTINLMTIINSHVNPLQLAFQKGKLAYSVATTLEIMIACAK